MNSAAEAISEADFHLRLSLLLSFLAPECHIQSTDTALQKNRSNYDNEQQRYLRKSFHDELQECQVGREATGPKQHAGDGQCE